MRNKTKPLPSALDALPAEAAPDVEWVARQVRAGRKAWLDIFAAFRARLEANAIEPPSFSAFNRHCMRLGGKTATRRHG